MEHSKGKWEFIAKEQARGQWMENYPEATSGWKDSCRAGQVIRYEEREDSCYNGRLDRLKTGKKDEA